MQAPTEADDPRSWRTVLPFLVGIGSFVALAAFNQARGFDLWRNYALSGVLLGSLATWAVWHHHVRIPRYIQWTIVAGLLLHYGGGSLGSPDPRYQMGLAGLHGINGAYHVFGWWDNLTHGVGIGAAAMAIVHLVEAYQTHRNLRWSAWAVGLTGWLSGLAAGVGVELYEYLGKTAFQTIDQGGYSNTMTDLGFNILGATVGATIAAAIAAHRRFAAYDGPAKPWPLRVPPGMTGYLVFVAVPACATVFLAARFLASSPPTDDRALYDPALQVMLQAAALGMAGGLLTAMGAREAARRRQATDKGESA